MFELRSGEKRLYSGVERVDDARPHLIMIYGNQRIIAQLNKHDVVKYNWHDTLPAAAPAAIRPAASSEAETHH
jgi:hypothetical protein